MLRNGALVLASLCLALGLAEVLARSFVSVRDVGPGFTVNDPVLGKRHKANFSTTRKSSEFTWTFSTNSHGFRGAEPFAAAAGSVLFLGDSFTMGFGVSDGEEYPALVGRRLKERVGRIINVVNAGMGGSGNGAWIRLLREEADRYRPSLVVFQFMANDFADNLRDRYFELTPLGELRELPVIQSRAKEMERYLDAIPWLSQSYLYALLREVVVARRPGAEARESDALAARKDAATRYSEALTERLIAEALAICRARGYAALALLVGLEGERLQRVSGWFEANGSPVLAVPTKIERPELYFRFDGHWNADGHRYVADAIIARLTELRYLQRIAQPSASRE